MLDLVTRQLTLAEGSDAAEAARLKKLLGIDGALIELNRALSEKIASGEVDLKTPGLSEHLWQTTMAKLAVDQPNYASYKRELGRESRVERMRSTTRHSGAAQMRRARNPYDAIVVIGLRARCCASPRNDDEVLAYRPSHFGGRFSENAFGPSM